MAKYFAISKLYDITNQIQLVVNHIISKMYFLTYRGSNLRTAISGLNRYKIALNEGNTLCKMRFPECVSGQLAVAVAEKDNP